MVGVSIGIPYVAYHLPEHVDTLRDWGRRTYQPETILSALERSGVRDFHVAVGQSALSLAASAIESLLRVAPIAPASIDCLIYTHTLQGSIAPPPQSLPRALCERFDFARAQSFSLAQQHCASSLGALRIVRAMFAAHPELNRVLLVGADTMPIDADRRMGTSGLLGDGAFAALIERHANVNRLVSLAAHASGLGWRGMLGEADPSFAAQYRLIARKLIAQVASDAGIALCQVRRILPPHLDRPAWQRLVHLLGLPATRLYIRNFARTAHVTVSDPFINLADCSTLAPGSSLILYAQGVGGFSASVLVIH